MIDGQILVQIIYEPLNASHPFLFFLLVGVYTRVIILYQRRMEGRRVLLTS